MYLETFNPKSQILTAADNKTVADNTICVSFLHFLGKEDLIFNSCNLLADDLHVISSLIWFLKAVTKFETVSAAFYFVAHLGLRNYNRASISEGIFQ